MLDTELIPAVFTVGRLDALTYSGIPTDTTQTMPMCLNSSINCSTGYNVAIGQTQLSILSPKGIHFIQCLNEHLLSGAVCN